MKNYKALRLMAAKASLGEAMQVVLQNHVQR